MTTARSALIDAAERLFAERGLDAVPLRDIAVAAGQRNSSVIQYHFGGRDGIVIEVFRRRIGEADRARAKFVEAIDRDGRGDDLAALVEALVLPIAGLVKAGGPQGSYARFFEQSAALIDFRPADYLDVSAASRDLRARLAANLTHLSAAVAAERIELVHGNIFSAFANFERRRSRSNRAEGEDLDRTSWHLIDMSVGALSERCSRSEIAADLADNSPPPKTSITG